MIERLESEEKRHFLIPYEIVVLDIQIFQPLLMYLDNIWGFNYIKIKRILHVFKSTYFRCADVTGTGSKTLVHLTI